MEWELGETVQEVQGKYIAVKGADADISSEQLRAIVDFGTMGFKLYTCMDGLALSVPGILMHDEADKTMLRSGNSSNGSNGTVINSMITNTDNVNKKVSGFE